MFILRVKGRCKNCGAIVEQSRPNIVSHDDFQQAKVLFDKRREVLQSGLDNHECSELESGVVETLSYRLD